MTATKGKAHILLIIGGGIAAYKACELIRLIRKQDMTVRCVLTRAGAQFVTPMSLAVLSGNIVHDTLWDLKDESEIGHIQLSREADLLLVCPATADLIAKMAQGHADDLATTLLLATDAPVMVAPAMNVHMWQHPATQRNLAQLRKDGVLLLDPDQGDMACGEYGPGRLPEPEAIMQAITAHLASDRAKARRAGGAVDLLADQPDFNPGKHRPLYGRHVLVSAGPTHEPIDPVRYLANRSSGKQGFAIAAAAAELGARVSLVAGPVALETPLGVERIDIETALEMQQAIEAALPADIALMVAAVADWRSAGQSAQKIKKKDGDRDPEPLPLTLNPDILAGLAQHPLRPQLLIGFAAETENIIAHGEAKRLKKGCDWIIANDVAGDVMGGHNNSIHIISAAGTESLQSLPKTQVATKLMAKIVDYFANEDIEEQR